MSALGVFGGSFDPVHHGHLALARAFARQFALPEVRLIPTGAAPHKPVSRVSPQQRADWLAQAVAHDTGLRVDRREVARAGYCYTIDTLRELQGENPEHLLVWLIGADSWLNFAQWRDWPALLELGHLVIAARPGHDLARLSPELASHWQQRLTPPSPECLSHGKISVLPMPLLPVSSTELRQRLARGENVEAFTPLAAAISASGLYKD